MNRVLIIDLKAVLHGVKFSIGKGRIDESEKNTFVIYGFLHRLKQITEKVAPTIYIFALDSDLSKRKKLYNGYKEGRRENRTQKQIDLDYLAYPQFTKIEKEILPSIGFTNIFGASGFEADDVIGRICKYDTDDLITICSSDKDMYQLLSDKVNMFDIRKNYIYTKKYFEKEYGIEPKMWKRVKAIGGCLSDKVKGVPIPQSDPSKKERCVGETTALNFLTNKLKPTTQAYKAITSRAGKDIINRNKALVILPFRGTPNFKYNFDILSYNNFKEICKKYNFINIVRNMREWAETFRLQ